MRPPVPLVVLLTAALLVAVAPTARAEIAVLRTGRTLSVSSHRYQGDTVTLVLRGGGEVTCTRTLVVRIDPDEVPYPEPLPDEAAPTSTARTPAPTDGPYAEEIASAARRSGIDPALVHAVIRAESNYRPNARSPRGARGLMQLMPATLSDYQVRNAYDPAANIDAGTRHLRTLLDRFPLAEALAAYNAGVAAVLQYDGIPPFPETRAYVARVLATLHGASSGPSR